MLDQHYLCLHLTRLRAPDQWASDERGLFFIFPKAGAGVCACGGATRAVRPGDVVVLGAAAVGRLCAAEKGEFEFGWFSAKLEHLYPLFAASEICLVPPVTDGFRSGKLYPASSPLAVECHKLLADAPPEPNLVHRCQVIKIAAAVLSVEFNTARVSRAGFVRAEEQMTATLERLSADEVLKLPVTELAGRFNCSQRQLNRLFHSRFGVSVAALRMELRLLRAMALLRDPTAKVINVAEQCGFNHLGLFNICFKRRFGASPGRWRRTISEAVPPPASLNAGQPACRMLEIGLCPWKNEPAEFKPAKTRMEPLSKAPRFFSQCARISPVVMNGHRRRNMVQCAAEPGPELMVAALAVEANAEGLQ